MIQKMLLTCEELRGTTCEGMVNHVYVSRPKWI